MNNIVGKVPEPKRERPVSLLIMKWAAQAMFLVHSGTRASGRSRKPGIINYVQGRYFQSPPRLLETGVKRLDIYRDSTKLLDEIGGVLSGFGGDEAYTYDYDYGITQSEPTRRAERQRHVVHARYETDIIYQSRPSSPWVRHAPRVESRGSPGRPGTVPIDADCFRLHFEDLRSMVPETRSTRDPALHNSAAL